MEQQRQYVGVDLHRRRSVIVRIDEHKAFAYQRVKKDRSDARLLADLLRFGRLPESWIAPPEVRELRKLVHYQDEIVDARAKRSLLVPTVDASSVASFSRQFGSGMTTQVFLGASR